MSLNVLTQGGGAGGETASIFITGLSESDTVSATKGGKTVNGKWVQKKNPVYVLPDGYTQLEYIQSSGTQYIDTGVLASGASLGWEIKCAWLDATKGSSMLGAFTWGGANGGTLAYSNGGTWMYQYGATSTQIEYKLGTLDYKPHIFKANVVSGEFSRDGETLLTGCGYSAIPNTTVYLFASHRSGETTFWVEGKKKIYYCKMYTDGALVRDFVPCVNPSGEIGLYDIANNQFYGNNGTGTFVAGAEIPFAIDGHTIEPIKEYGTWTVSATNGEDTVTQDVLVDVAMDYEIEMGYRLYLYNEGDECEDITGGWGTNGYSSSSHTLGAATKNIDSFYFNGESFVIRMLGTLSAVDFTEYTKLKAEVNNVSQQVASTPPIRIVVQSTKDTDSTPFVEIGSTTLGTQTYEADVSNIEQAAYVRAFVGRNVNTSGYIYKVWLE